MVSRHVSFMFAALAAVGIVGVAGRHLAVSSDTLPPPDARGYIALFNGRDLEGWAGLADDWSVVDGAISGHQKKEDSKQTFLVRSGLTVENFELHFKYRFMSAEGNSGVQFRSSMMDRPTSRVGGYQADFDAESVYDGSIYDEGGIAGNRGTMSDRGERTTWDAQNGRKSEPLGRTQADLKTYIHPGGWNDAVLVAEGPHITYRINGHLMTEMFDRSPSALQSGLLALQLHQGYTMEVRFKDLEIKLLK